MDGESKNAGNIDMYRPTMVLRSSTTVKRHHQFTKLSKIQKSPCYRGLALWDNLPKEYQTMGTKSEFKRVIKQYRFEPMV